MSLLAFGVGAYRLSKLDTGSCPPETFKSANLHHHLYGLVWQVDLRARQRHSHAAACLQYHMKPCCGAGKQSVARCSSTGRACHSCGQQHGQRSAGRPRPATQVGPGAVPSSPHGGSCPSGLLPSQVAACACASAGARPAETAQGRNVSASGSRVCDVHGFFIAA